MNLPVAFGAALSHPPRMAEPCCVIVLAAGRGSRYAGRTHKLAARLDHRTVLAGTLENAIGSGLPVVVVTTEPLVALACESVAARDVVVLPEATDAADLGMGSSIAAGVQLRPDAAGWLVLPGDMPLVQPATVRAVARELEDHAIAYAQHHGRRGHPVGFAAELYSDLVRLHGDEGARRLVARYPARAVDCDDPGILIDIDTALDLELAQAGPRWPPALDSAF